MQRNVVLGLLLALACGCASPTAPVATDASVDARIAMDSTPVGTDSGLPPVEVPPPVVARPGFRVTFDLPGRVRVESGGYDLGYFHPTVVFANGRVWPTVEHQVAGIGGDRIAGTLPGAVTMMIFRRELPGGAVALDWGLTATEPVRSFELRGEPRSLPPDTRMVMDGAQSWSFAGPLVPPQNTAHPRGTDGRFPLGTELGNPLADRVGASIFRGDLVWSGGGLSICAAPPYDRWSAVFVERPGPQWTLHLASGLAGDPDRTGSITGRFVIAPASPDTAFACTSALDIPRTRGARPFPRGWWSWNTLFENVTVARTLAQVAPMRALDPSARHITIDDGWERAWGDWVERPAFGGTLDSLSTALTQQGITLGLWLAPLAVSPEAPLAREHRDWLVRSADGTPLSLMAVPGRSYHVLDATHPDARRWLVDLFRGLRARGVRLFKIDFLYLGIVPGRRFSATASGLSAYTSALEAIAEGAGDAHINGCGALILPTLPFVDSLRIGADVTFGTSPPFWGAVTAMARNYAARAQITRFAVTADPDQPVARVLPLDEARAFLALGAISGAFGYGDDFSALDPTRAALYREPWYVTLRDGLSRPATPTDPTDPYEGRYYASPLIDLALSGARSSRARAPRSFESVRSNGDIVRLLFNWTDEEEAHQISAGLFSGDVVELVTGTPLRASGANYSVSVPPRAVRVVSGAPSPRR